MEIKRRNEAEGISNKEKGKTHEIKQNINFRRSPNICQITGFK
jgi:hypothetical protein